MTQLDFWRDRYQSQNTPWDLGAASPHFTRWLQHWDPEQFPVGRMAVLGCGRGHDAALFAQAGFDTVGFDYAPEAIAEAQRLYPNLGQFIQADIFALPQAPSPWGASFDYVLEHTCFCAIPPARRIDYANTVHHLLKPNGYLIGIFWENGEADGPPFNTTEAEAHQFFNPDTGFKAIMTQPNPAQGRRSGTERLMIFQNQKTAP